MSLLSSLLNGNEDTSNSTPLRQLQDPVRMRAEGGNQRVTFGGRVSMVLVQDRIRNINTSFESPKVQRKERASVRLEIQV